MSGGLSRVLSKGGTGAKRKWPFSQERSVHVSQLREREKEEREKEKTAEGKEIKVREKRRIELCHVWEKRHREACKWGY